MPVGQHCDIDLAPLSDSEKIRVGLSSFCFNCGDGIQAVVARQRGFAIEQYEDGRWRFVCHKCQPVDLESYGEITTVEAAPLSS